MLKFYEDAIIILMSVVFRSRSFSAVLAELFSFATHQVLNSILSYSFNKQIVWGIPANFNWFCILVALLIRTLVVDVS